MCGDHDLTSIYLKRITCSSVRQNFLVKLHCQVTYATTHLPVWTMLQLVRNKETLSPFRAYLITSLGVPHQMHAIHN